LVPAIPEGFPFFSLAEQSTGQNTPGEPNSPFGCPRAKFIRTFPRPSPGEPSTTRKVGNGNPGSVALSRERRGGAGPTPRSSSSSDDRSESSSPSPPRSSSVSHVPSPLSPLQRVVLLSPRSGRPQSPAPPVKTTGRLSCSPTSSNDQG
jgi:hypothetical protein